MVGAGQTCAYLTFVMSRQQGAVDRDLMVVHDYTGNAKPASLKTILQALRVNASAVIQKPDPNRTVDFRVQMGRSYGRSCLLEIPQSATREGQ